MSEAASLTVTGMHCAACARTIEKAIARIPGIETVGVDYLTRRADVTFQPERTSPAAITATVAGLGYAAVPLSPVVPPTGLSRRARFELGACATAIMVSMAAHVAGMGGHATHTGSAVVLIQAAVATLLLATIGRRYVHRALAATFQARMVTADTLVVAAAGGAWLEGVVALAVRHPGPVAFDAATMIVALIHAGNLLKDGAVDAARAGLRVAAAEGDRKFQVSRNGVPRMERAEHLFPGDIIRIPPGAKLPVDGVVTAGESTVIESMLTGEPMPVTKSPGSEVIGGTVNQAGALTVRAVRAGAATRLAAIEREVEAAARTRPRLAELGDRIARMFVPAALLLAVAAGTGWWLAGAGPWRAIEAAVAVLATACPCALTLAPGAALAVSLGRAARAGLLVRSADAIDRAARITRIAFDKTGTLTTGAFTIIGEHAAPGSTVTQAIMLAAAVEADSEHPVATAFEERARRDGLTVPAAEAFQAIAGRGVTGRVGAKTVLVGSPALLAAQGVDLAPLAGAVADLTAAGLTTVIVAADHRALAAFGLGDTPRPGAHAVVASLRDAGVAVSLLTGDHPDAAALAAAAAGIQDVGAGLSPTDKLARIAAWRAAGDRVAMVGDGINDAPALAGADVGVALQTGTELALGAADMGLVGGRLEGLATLIPWARATRRVIGQNYAWALLFNVVMLPAAALGTIPPAAGALAMGLSSLLVVGNAMRLRA